MDAVDDCIVQGRPESVKLVWVQTGVWTQIVSFDAHNLHRSPKENPAPFRRLCTSPDGMDESGDDLDQMPVHPFMHAIIPKTAGCPEGSVTADSCRPGESRSRDICGTSRGVCRSPGTVRRSTRLSARAPDPGRIHVRL